MKIGSFLAEIEPKTLKKTHYGDWVVGEERLLEGGVCWVFYGSCDTYKQPLFVAGALAGFVHATCLSQLRVPNSIMGKSAGFPSVISPSHSILRPVTFTQSLSNGSFTSI